MMNQHGLTRVIPEGVKRAVRRACGFGCVVCGCGLYQYEHVEPPFADAHSHDPAAMALLCGTCHDHVTRGRWSKDRVKMALARPRCLEAGFSFTDLDIGLDSPVIRIAGTEWRDCDVILQAGNEPLLSVKPPEYPGTPFRLSASLFSSTGEMLLEIQDNEIRQYAAAWDIETVGPTVVVRNQPRDIALELRSLPGTGVVIEKLQMFSPSGRIVADASGMSVVSRAGSVMKFPRERVVGSGCGIGIHVTDRVICVAQGGGEVRVPGLIFDGLDVGFVIRMSELARAQGLPLPGDVRWRRFDAEYDFERAVGKVIEPSTGAVIREIPVSQEKLETVPRKRFGIEFPVFVCTLPDGSEVSLFDPETTGREPQEHESPTVEPGDGDRTTTGSS